MLSRTPVGSGVFEELRRNRPLRSAILVCLFPGIVLWTPGYSNPRGGNVVHGNVNIGSGNGGNLQIRQNSNSAIINWESFSIDAGELTQFRQPNSNAAVLNRVTGGDPSAIHGALKGNGNVFVINPNGILVGPGGTIDVHGLVLSTLDVDNGEFLAGGDMNFKGVGKEVTNMGRINGIGGDVFLIGRTVRNSGAITASSGTVGLAAGEEVLLTAQGNTGERLFVRAKGAGVSGTGILNDGTIEGAAVELKAHGNLFALAINNKGSIRATGAVNSGGKVFLRGAGGSVRNSGSIHASGPGIGSGGRVLIEAAYAKVDGMMRAERGHVRITGTEKVELGGKVDVSTSTGKGGEVVVEGKEIEIGSAAFVDASGDIGGGYVRVGGGFQGRDSEVMNADRVIIDDGAMLRADATASGSGGNLIVWSDGDTVFEGGLSARGVSGGGFAEISGKSTLEVTGSIDLSASEGGAGTLLLDPTNITISATGAAGLGGSTISNVWLSQQLDLGTNVVISTNFGAGSDAGHITIGRTDTTANAAADRIQWYRNNAATPGGTLSLLAMGDIRFNTAVQSAGEGGINVVAGWDGSTGLSMGNFSMAAVLATMNDGNGANDAAGIGNGSVYVGATNSRIGVNVGSRFGATNVAGRDLVLRGSTTIGHGWAQVGFTDNGVEYQLSRSHNGVILNEWWGSTAGNVQAKNYIALLGGTEFGTGDINTLGMNAFRGAGWGASGDIAAAMSGRVDARGGTTSSYTQIGHGGTLRDGTEDKWSTGQPARTTRDGIQIDSGGASRFSIFSSTWRTNYAGTAARIDGDISVTAGGDILLLGNRGFAGATDDQATSADDGIYTMIGHGGVENQGSYHGNISVTAHGATAAPTVAVNNGLQGLGLQVLGGRGMRDFAMIGHGSGYEGNPRTIWDQTRSGNITVNAVTGAIRLQAHNQAIREGDLNTGRLIGPNEPTPLNNASDNSNLGSFVQIGHGGQASSLHAAAGTFIMPGGTNVTNILPDASMSGNINVTAGGTYLDPANADTPIGILVRAGNRRWQHAMIGHGGTNHNAVNAAAQTPSFGAATLPFGTPALAASTGFNGNLRVDADQGSVIATGGDNFRADRVWGYGFNFARVGHGGDVVRGNKGGTITVLAGQGAGATAGDIRFTAGRTQRDHAHLGHGGYDSGGSILGAENSAEIIVTAGGDISFASPESGDKDALGLSTEYAYWWYSNASAAGAPQTAQPGYWETTDRWVMLGHGGRSSTTVMPNRQDISVTSGTHDANNADGDASTGGITFISGDMERDFAQLGHGGYVSSANNADGFTGDIFVNALGGGLRFDGSVLGAQGIRRAADRSLNGIAIATTTAGFGGGAEAYVQLGHGGYSSRGVHTGDIFVNSWGGVDFLAAPAAPAVNHAVTTAPIDAAINAGTYVWVQLAGLRAPIATPSTLAFATAELDSNVIPGTIRIVLSDGRVITDVVRISSDDRSSITGEANGLYLDGVKVGDVNYDWGLVRFNNTTNPLVGSWTGTGAIANFQTAQGLKERAYAQLGHGGYDADGPNNKANNLPTASGDITIRAGGDIRFEAGAAYRNYAQLGHGGLDTRGVKSGDISIDHIDAGSGLGRVGGLRFLAGHGGHRHYDHNSYAQLGHGGYTAHGNSFGNITVTGTSDADGMGLLLKAGTHLDAYAQIGHGGFQSRSGTGDGAGSFGLNGNITVNVEGDISVVAGTFTTNNPAWRDDGRNYAQIGHGGWDADPSNNNTVNFGQTGSTLPAGTAGAGEGNWGHFGDISLTTTGGNVNVMGGSTIALADRLDFNGNPLPLGSDPNGFLVSHGTGKGRYHWAQVGHGGYATSGNHNGNVTALAESGSVNLVGGMLTNDDGAEKYNYSQIGHGGAEAQGHLGRTTQTIRVHALGANGNVLVAAGNGNRNQAMIGNGGLNFDGSHTGNIEVYAGNDIFMQGGIAHERVVRRIGEFQEMTGVDGGNGNDIGEFNGYYGASGLGYVMLDAAASAGGGALTKLIGGNIQPGTVQFRLAIAAPALFDANKAPEYIDDGAGNIVASGDPLNVVGTINYSTGEVRFTQAVIPSNNTAQPDLFVNYAHRTGIRNDALYANATIGHGGYASGSRVEAHPEAGSGFVNRGIIGNIDVRAGVDALGNFTGNGGSITAIAGNDQRTYVQIGHGGMDSGTPANHAFSGNIAARADGEISFRGGGGLVDNHHIAFNYYGTGSTEVTAVTVATDLDRVSPTYATVLGQGTRSISGITDILYAFAHIGHGGVTAHANNARDNNVNDPLAASTPESGHNGNIFVQTNTGDIDFTGGGVRGYGHFAMIGHGGYSALGNHFGDIKVNSGADINFTAGGDTYRANANEGRNFVQIGHGGRASTGNLVGDIDVDAVGSINFQGGDVLSDRSAIPYGAHVFVLNAAGNQDENHYNRTEGRLNRAQIGHGGDNVYGDKTGSIDVTAGDGINFRGGDRVTGSLDNNAAYLNFASIGHGGYAAWRQYRVNNTTPALPGTAGAADDWNLPFQYIGSTYVFDGTGQFFWAVDNSGNAAVGLGNPLYDGFSGDVTVTATGGDIRFTGGISVGGFGQIGHGGVETAGDHNGNITVTTLNGDIDFNANRIEQTGSSSTASYHYTMIGHGGAFSSGEQSGSIDVTSSNKIRFKGGRGESFAMVGHGGRESHGTLTQGSGVTTYRRSGNALYSANTLYRPGSRSGDIRVNATGDIAFEGGSQFGDRAFTQIGHGGFNIHANPDPTSQFGDGHSGAINVVSDTGSILLMGGQATSGHAMIGHGGTQSFGNHGGDGTGNRRVSDILVEAATGIRVLGTGRFSSNTTAANFAQVGHGGRQSSFRDAHDIDAALYAKLQPATGYINPNTGAANVDDAGSHPLTPFTTNTDGLALGSLAAIGAFKGDITLRTTGAGADIQFLAPDAAEGTLGINGTDSSVQLGHGGWRSFADAEGDITVESAGGLEFRGLQGTALAPNVNSNHNAGFALLGHGGWESGGSYNGNITVTAEDGILFRGADSVNGANAGFVQLGHGGHSTWKGTAQYLEAIRNPTTGVIPVAALGAGNSGNISVTTGGDLEFYAGRDNTTFAQLGHGGFISRGSHSGNITVNATGGIAFHGGVDYLDTNPAQANPGGNEGSHAMLGHGGYDSDGTHSGDIGVTAGQFAAGHAEAGQGIVFRAGAWNDNFTQLGHGGFASRTYGVTGNEQGLSGAISVTTTGDITFVGGTANFFNFDEDSRLYAQLGHGGYDVDVTQDGNHVIGNGIGHHGSISVSSTAGRIFFGAGDADRADQASVGTGEGRFHSAQLGHGGYEARGDHHGNVTVSAATDIIFLGGSSEDNDNELVNYAQLGHGGRTAVGNQGRTGETIAVTAGRDVIFRAGNSQDSPVQLGNGGRESRGDHAGDLVVRAGRHLEFAAAQGRHLVSDEEKNFDLTRATEFGSQTSDAIYDLEGSNVIPGTIVITVPNGPILEDDGNGNIVVTGGDPGALLALGLVVGDTVGTIWYTGGVNPNGRIIFTRDVNPNNAASPAAALLATVSYESLEIAGSYAQLGNGGYNADNPDGGTAGATSPGNTGNISVFAGGDVLFKGGVGAQGYSQLGHGGYITEGRNSGDISIGSATERIGGGVILTGGNGEYYDSGNAYAQIGHGGQTARGTHTGNISIHTNEAIAAGYEGIGLQLQAGSRNNNYAQVGHGGNASRSGTGDGVAGMEGNSGDIYVNSIGDVNLVAGVLNRGGSTAGQSVDDGSLYAQIGHGGYDADVSLNGDIGATGGPGYNNGIGHNGTITVISQQGSVNVLAADHMRSHLPSLAPYAGVYDGLINNGITRNDSYAGGRHHYAMIGHGGIYAVGNHWGDITVQAGFNDAAVQTGTLADSHVRVTGGRFYADQDESQQFAQIGHGGRSAVGQQGRTDDVTSVMAAGNVEVHAGDGVDSSAQIGNGGTNARGDHRGDVQIFAGGDVSVLAGQFSRIQTPGNGIFTRYYHVSTANAGELNQNTDRAGLLQAVTGGVAAGVLNFRGVNGVTPGTLKVDVYNDLGLRIGTIEDDGTGALRVVSDFTELVGGASLVAGQQVGTVNYAASNLTFTTRVNPGAEGGAANVIVSMEHVRTDRAFAQIGHGGYDADDPNNDNALGATGDISVTAMGDISVRGGLSLNNYAQVGHGGYETRGAASGNITMRAGNDVHFEARGQQDRAYVQIGHGGWDADGNHTGDVIVTGGSGGLGTSLGLGLFNDLGDFNRDGFADVIQFAAVAAGDGTVTLTGGTFTDSWVQVGHGGRSSGNTVGNTSTMTGNVGVAANGDVTLQGGIAARGFTQIGHGGWEDGTLNMTLGGDISVISQTGLLRILAGAGSEAYSLVGHGSLRNAATSVPLGTRSGDIYLEAANWEIVPVGTTSLARIGHRSQAVNNGLTAGNQFSLIGNGADGTNSYLINDAFVSLMGVRDHLAGGGGATFGAIGNLVMDLALTSNSAGSINMLATGDLTVRRGVQNAGSGDVNAVAGWDGITPSLDFLDHIPMRDIDISSIYAAPMAWGNNGAVASIGDGTQTARVPVGSAGGTTTVLGDAVEVIGSDAAGNGFAMIGFASSPGVNPTGAILVASRDSGVSLLGGSSSNAYAQIGHRALGTLVSSMSGAITVISDGDLTVQGGSGLQTSAQIGHGAAAVTLTSINGAITVDVANDIVLTGGIGSVAYAQIGNGGSATNANMTGPVMVTAGGSIAMAAPNVGNLAFSKIGHGDDLRSASAALAGTGTRAGDVEVSAGSDISLTGAMIGHVNSLSGATTLSGVTRIGVSRDNPSDPSAGSLIADAASRFHGEDELRFYLPRRENSQIAAGAVLNGAVWRGASTDPAPVQRIDEYTINIIGNPGSTPNEHGNVFGTGPAPVNAAGFAFYYDTILMGPAPFVPMPPVPPAPPSPPSPSTPPLPPVPPAPDFPSFFPDDQTTDDWQREQEDVFSGPGQSNFYYEGFSEDGFFGENVFAPGSDVDLSADEEEMMRRHLRLLGIEVSE